MENNNFIENSANTLKRQTQLAYLDITQADLQLMSAQRDLFLAQAGEVVENFYQRLLGFSYLKELIDRNSTVEKLKSVQKEYFISLTDAAIDDNYIKRRLIIGKKHQQIGLYPKWYLGAYQIYTKELQRVLALKYDVTSKEYSSTLEAFLKRLNLDMQLAIESYMLDQLQQLISLQQDIGSVAEIIQDISEQTNMLSLNASIEAARAGNQGRAFAVVAQEVRTLAERSSKSAKDIATMVSSNREAIEKMKQTTEE